MGVGVFQFAWRRGCRPGFDRHLPCNTINCHNHCDPSNSQSGDRTTRITGRAFQRGSGARGKVCQIGLLDEVVLLWPGARYNAGMLGVAGIIAMVLGGFAAGGGAFDWEFLFSDGYREHAWVRSLGRDGARGLLILLGSVLVVVGFVSQVIDSASQPVVAVASTANQTFLPIDANDEPASTGDFTGGTASKVPGPRATPAPSVAGPTVGQTDYFPVPQPTTPGAIDESSGAAEPGPQPMTIWNPEADSQHGDTIVSLQYRFEPGHRPRPGSHYLWIIDLVQATSEVHYDAEAMQRQGQLTHIVRSPLKGSGFDRSWSTYLVVETNGRRAQVSNRLEIMSGEGVRSTPLTGPQ